MKRYSTEEKEKFIEGWKTSGKSKWIFAKEQGLVPQTFCKWITRKNETTNFVELRTKLKICEPTNKEIVLERGEVRIRVPFGISREEIESVAALWKLLV